MTRNTCLELNKIKGNISIEGRASGSVWERNIGRPVSYHHPPFRFFCASGGSNGPNFTLLVFCKMILVGTCRMKNLWSSAQFHLMGGNSTPFSDTCSIFARVKSRERISFFVVEIVADILLKI